MTGFVCTICGEYHESLPMGFGAIAPDYWHDLPDAERKTGCILDEEICIIKDTYFFIKGNIELPVQGEDDFFVYTVWVSVSKDSFDRIVARWRDPRRVEDPPYFGYLATRLPTYPETINLKSQVYNEDLGLRPAVIL